MSDVNDDIVLVHWEIGSVRPAVFAGDMHTATVGHKERTVRDLVAGGELSPGALDMPIRDVLHQYNNVNGGEAWLTEAGECGPAVCRRTEKNPDGTDPALWVFFVDPAEAHLWRDSGQVESVEQAEP